MEGGEIVSGNEHLPRRSTQVSRSRFWSGIFLLVIVNIVWVASSEISRYVFADLDYNKPYLSTYLSLSMFSFYLLGFLMISSWRKQCFRCTCDGYPGQYLKNQPVYVPVEYSSDTESSDTEWSRNGYKVKFVDALEVKHLKDTSAARTARMPYLAALRLRFLPRKHTGNLTVPQIAKLSSVFTFVFFAGALAYEEAVSFTEVAVVNVIFSSSSLFTLLLSAIFPSDERDKFTICKLFAVIMCIGGIVIVSVSGGGDLSKASETGTLWALVGAISHAVYLVLLRRVAGDDLNVSMFFAFVGVFACLLLWPGLLVLHYTGVETFELPDKQTAIYFLANGLVGTVLSEILWLRGCLLTTSFLGTLSMSLMIPLSLATDIIFRKVTFTWLFFAGAFPVFLSFIFVSVISSTEDTQTCCCRKWPSAHLEQEIPLTGVGSSKSDMSEDL